MKNKSQLQTPSSEWLSCAKISNFSDLAMQNVSTLITSEKQIQQHQYIYQESYQIMQINVGKSYFSIWFQQATEI